MGYAPKLKVAAKSLARRQQALKLVSEGLPITEVALQMGLSAFSVRNHLHKALETESLFPGNLNAEEVAELRQIEAEQLN